MARYQLILAYDGTAFLGYQRQKGARTVQGEVEVALQQLGWLGTTSLSAGRTDTGVHAAGQVIAFDLDWGHSAEELGRALNAILPQDVAVRGVQEVQAGFHPRYHASSRTYRYRLYCSPDRQPLLERFAWRVWPAVDFNLLEQAARLLVGEHDFAAFGNPPRVGGSTVRTITQARWTSFEEDLRFEVSANAFLYHMVRRMVFLQVAAAQNRLSFVELADAVQAIPPGLPGLAPAHGLVLWQVAYEYKT
jgi:tRNA pseudouridine38-40 synthase